MLTGAKFHIFIACVIIASSKIAVSAEPQPNELLSNSPSTYTDKLIDDDIPEDRYEDYYKHYLDPDSNLSHEIELRSEWRENSFDDGSTTSSAIGYTAFKSSHNYGDILLNLTAIDDSDRHLFTSSNTEDGDSDNDISISRYSLQQTQFPLTESIHMSNTIGTHRPISRGNTNIRRAYSRNFIGRRFNANEADILGVTSRLFRNDSSVSLSSGKLGRNRGFLLPGYEEDEGKVDRLQANQAFQSHLLTSDLWKTRDFQDSDQDRLGGRITLDSILPKHWKSSLTAAQSDDSFSFLGGLEKDLNNFRQNFGAYFYDPDFVWINRRLGDDNSGVYYRFSNRRNAYLFGGSAELRRDGIDNVFQRKDTLLLNANLGYRINRTNRVNGFYSYRQVDNLNETRAASAYEEHRLRTFLNLAHGNDTQSSFGVSARNRQSEQSNNENDEVSVFYTYHQQFDIDNGIDAALEVSKLSVDENDQNSYSIDLGWNRALRNEQAIRISLGYSNTDSDGNTNFSNEGWHGNFDYHWDVNDRLLFDARAGYNTETSQFDTSNDVSQDLLTDLDIENLDETSYDNLFVQIGIRYSLGGRHESNTIAKLPGLIGSGSIRGRLFIDTNGDGVFQSNESGLANIEIFLDSVFPSQTDKDGSFIFRNVGIGNHYIFVDEASLPLPWSLNGQEFRNINVRLRSVNTLDIGVANIDSLQ